MSKTGPVVGALASGARLHEYDILDVLGHGGFGITYLARDSHLDKRFAIKEYLPTDLAVRGSGDSVTVRASDSREAFNWGREQFMKEARVLARYNHPNIIQVHRFFEANDTAYFVMEYAEGVTLDQILKQENTVSEQRIRAILQPIMDGLDVIHRSGVLHRDIKPSNIILRSDGTPVLIDFGAARLTLGNMTRSMMSLITAGYAPIEQYSTTGSQGPWTDIYALGAVAYRAALGTRPVDSVSRLRNDPVAPAVELGRDKCTPHFLAAIDWAMAVHETDRPKTIAEWRLALDGGVVPPPLDIEIHPSSEGKIEKTEILGRTEPMTPRSTPTRMVSEDSVPTVIAPHTRSIRRAGWKRHVLPVAAALLVLLVAVETYFLLRGGFAQDGPAEPAAQAAVPGAIAAPAPSPTPAPAAQPTAAESAAVKKNAAASTTVAASEAEAPAEPAAKPAQRTAADKAKTTSKLKSVAVSAMAPMTEFKDCKDCPAMLSLPAGHFRMGTDDGNRWEGPAHEVALRKPFAIGRFEVTGAQWQACVAAKGCAPGATGGKGSLPVINVSFGDAQAYADWLARSTGRKYRLPTEAEWEYALRAGSTTARFWGDDRRDQCLYANGADTSALKNLKQGAPIIDCDDGHPNRSPVGSFKPNAFGLFDMAGNVWEWTQDCWQDNFRTAPVDGSAAGGGGCDQYVIRGGSWNGKPESFRSANRGLGLANQRGDDLGFRVAAE